MTYKAPLYEKKDAHSIRPRLYEINMHILNHLLLYIDTLFGYQPLLLVVTLIALALKLYILINIITYWGKTTTTNKRSVFFLIVVIMNAIIIDLAWVLLLLKLLLNPGIYSSPSLFIVRASWGCFALQYQALTLLLEKLIDRQPELSLRQKVLTFISVSFFLFYIGIAILNFDCKLPADRPAIEFTARAFEIIFLLIILMPTTLIIVWWKQRTTVLPKLIQKQLNTLIPVLIIPIWIFDIFQMFPIPFTPNWITNSYAATTLTTIFLTYAIFFCTRKVMALRFLNFKQQAQSPIQFNFIDGFKDVLEKLSHATTATELQHITQDLFKAAFDIPTTKTKLYIRKPNNAEYRNTYLCADQENSKFFSLVEHFLSSQPHEVNDIASSRIAIYDEIAFNNFYDPIESNINIARFLEELDIDVFLPIYEKNSLIGYIVVEREAHPDKVYGNVEHDEMLVFASYLANIINLLQTRNLTVLMQQEKDLREELYYKHQEINQYKESIRSFLRTTQQKDIGIIFYKRRSFSFANKTAKDFIGINPNYQPGHPIAKTLKNIVQNVEEQKTAYTSMTYDKQGNKLMLIGVPNSDNNNIVITIYHPDVSDIIRKQIDLLQDPSKWDYLLYLETTHSGKLINQLIPGNGQTLLNFKITLLHMALSKKAILLDMPEEDLLPTVEIIHHTSLRETLYTLDLATMDDNTDIIIKLFGVNSLFHNTKTPPIQPLLEQLNETGTLFIRNIHYLNLETQDALAEFIRYGHYRVFKSDQLMKSNVRIICSTSQNLTTLVSEGSFSSKLFGELKAATLCLPSLTTLSNEEINTLADGFIDQTIKMHDMKNIFELTEKDRIKFIHKRPISLVEFKEKIQQLLKAKSKETMVYTTKRIDHGFAQTDPLLLEASRLGKHALRDPKIMGMLWEKFKSQNKIASFLGVNRSSVNRRCREYNLE